MERVTAAEREPVEVEAGVYLADLAAGERTSMKYWRVEPGATLPTHRHHNEQTGYVIAGSLVATVDGEEHRLEPGDSYVFASEQLHGARNRGDEPAIGVGILSPPRGAPKWGRRNRAQTEPSDGPIDRAE